MASPTAMRQAKVTLAGVSGCRRSNSATPDDVPMLDRLRGTCPARKTDETVDVDVAVKLVENAVLYRQALGLAALGDTVTASVGGGAGAASAVALELPVVHQ